jgi:uridine kinase
MMLWESVRENEELNIFPNALKCTYRIDSTHNYELGVLRPYLERLLRTVPVQSAHYEDALRILERISKIEPIDSELIQNNSLYKEFV